MSSCRVTTSCCPWKVAEVRACKYSRIDQAAAACVVLKQSILGDAKVVEGAGGSSERSLRTAMFFYGQLELANLVV
jgi:hypothetical protein